MTEKKFDKLIKCVIKREKYLAKKIINKIYIKMFDKIYI
jgi:hypothetical protein